MVALLAFPLHATVIEARSITEHDLRDRVGEGHAVGLPFVRLDELGLGFPLEHDKHARMRHRPPAARRGGGGGRRPIRQRNRLSDHRPCGDVDEHTLGQKRRRQGGEGVRVYTRVAPEVRADQIRPPVQGLSERRHQSPCRHAAEVPVPAAQRKRRLGDGAHVGEAPLLLADGGEPCRSEARNRPFAQVAQPCGSASAPVGRECLVLVDEMRRHVAAPAPSGFTQS